ncbi:MAG: PIN domain nuclease [Chloroflexi bacterium]|nr:PIN domain nuclease [Chloroflexota bacterium]
MVIQVMRLVAGALLAVAGWRIGPLVSEELAATEAFLPWGLAFLVVGTLVGYFLSGLLLFTPVRTAYRKLGEVPFSALSASVAGLLVGLIVAALLSIPFSRLPGPAGIVAPIALSLLLGALGTLVMVRREADIAPFLPEGNRARTWVRGGRTILLDTSAIIDGRIADLVETGFIQSSLSVPQFVLDELRHVADSADALRRNRGRRGLEILSSLSKLPTVPLKIIETNGNRNIEVDIRLVELAKSMKALIMTTDFNLNRVAELQGVKVLNVNDLANALRPVLLPGEDFSIRVMQEGKEPGQGVGFLDDGTMVVVESGRRFINQTVEVSVTRVLQTSSGRLIFAQPKTGGGGY